MKSYIKNFAAMRTVRSMDVIASAMCLDSTETESSTITVADIDISRDLAGAWLVCDGNIWLIDQITPQVDRTIIQCLDPLDAFSRPLLFSAPSSGATVGSFIQQQLNANWRDQADGVYAMPYLIVQNADTTPFIAPELDDNGLFSMSDYIRQMRRNHQIETRFFLSGDTLQVSILRASRQSWNLVFNDGHAQLESVAYSRSGVAKITAIQNGVATDWYLSESGLASTNVPDKRAVGTWEVLSLTEKDVQKDKVMAAFAKNSESHKVEFWSNRQFAVYDQLTIRLYGEVLRSHVSYVGRRSTDDRFYYKSGELAVTAADKLKGVING